MEQDILREIRKIALITQGLTRVVEPIAKSGHVIEAIIDAPPRVKKKNLRKASILGASLRKLFIIFGFKKPSLKQYCINNDVPYYEMASMSDDELVNLLIERQVELLVVYSMSRLLSEKVFSVPKYGAINLHPSYLPTYRGPNPWFWSYYNQDERGGVTVHCIDKGEDTGDILLQEYFDIPRGIKSPQMQDKAIGSVGSRLLVKAINEINTLPRLKQPLNTNNERARNLAPEEHKSIIDWEKWPVEKVWHLLRGTELWLNVVEQPSGLYKGMRWDVQNYDERTIAPGDIGVVHKKEGRYILTCFDGIIHLKPQFVLSIFIRNILGR